MMTMMAVMMIRMSKIHLAPLLAVVPLPTWQVGLHWLRGGLLGISLAGAGNPGILFCLEPFQQHFENGCDGYLCLPIIEEFEKCQTGKRDPGCFRFHLWSFRLLSVLLVPLHVLVISLVVFGAKARLGCDVLQHLKEDFA